MQCLMNSDHDSTCGAVCLTIFHSVFLSNITDKMASNTTAQSNEPTSPVSTHGEVVKTNKPHTFDAICFEPFSQHCSTSSAIRTHGKTTVRRPEKHVCRKSWLREENMHESV